MIFNLADLFCGAGGTSEGAIRAVEDLGMTPRVTAVNHWMPATETFMLNHPGHRVLCTGVDDINPRDLYKPGELDLLWASPECTHHSIARGGKPINEQSRATAWCVIRWLDALAPPIVLIENVREFLTWGGLCANGRPLVAQRGKTFRAWVEAMKSLGYRVDWRMLRAADYGDPTTRERLFVQAVRGRRKIMWPEPGYAQLPEGEDGQAQLFLKRRKPWITARNGVIDWSIVGQSIYQRKKPLSAKTMNRILAGLRKFGLKAFMVPAKGERPGQAERTHSVDAPLPTVTATGHQDLCQVFLVRYQGDHANRDNSDRCVQSVDEPMSTATTENRFGLANAFVVNIDNLSDPHGIRSIDAPLSTITTEARHALADPFLVHLKGTSDEAVANCSRSIDRPLPALCTGQHVAMAEPFLVQTNHGNGEDINADNRRVRSIDDPMQTVTGRRGEWAKIDAHLLPQHSGGELRTVDEPAPTVATAGAIAMVESYLVKYYGTAGAQSIETPLDSVTTKERHALCTPIVLAKIGDQTYLVDIRFRMLQPHELAAAQGFPKGYRFSGNKTQQVKQIGNAVPCNLARALVKAVIEQ